MFIVAYGAMVSYLMIVKGTLPSLLGVDDDDEYTKRAILTVSSMCYLFLSLEKFLECDPEDVLSMIRAAQVDFDEFERNRREKIATYIDLLATYGLETDPKLVAIHENAKKEEM